MCRAPTGNGRRTRDPRLTINQRGVWCSVMASQEQTKKDKAVNACEESNRPEDVADDERARAS
jgi:hypothetical protein